jgi:myo-inositol-1(or 4)-monophosphatase
VEPFGPLRRETEVAIAAVAIAAVEVALRTAHERAGASELMMKTTRDVVTATDLAIEDAVRAGMAKTSETPVIGEERGGEAVGRAHWIVDPICGTRNFASGIPLYCVNLALVEGDLVTIAVVGDASTGDILVAQAGDGAWRQEGDLRLPITVGAESQTIVIEDSHADGPRREQAANFLAGMVRADRWDLRALSSTVSLAYLAGGRISAYVLFWTSAIHSAAGSLIAAEAGAVVSDLAGEPWTIRSDSLLACADRTLHEEMLERLRTAGSPAGG